MSIPSQIPHDHRSRQRAASVLVVGDNAVFCVLEGDFIGADAEVVDKGIPIEVHGSGHLQRVRHRECFDQFPASRIRISRSARTVLSEPEVDLEFH